NHQPPRSKTVMRRAVIVEALRTPIGRAHAEKGIFRDVRADELSADLISAVLQRAGVPAAEVEDVHFGCVKQQGEQGYNVSRMAGRNHGLPMRVERATETRVLGWRR